MAKLNIDIGVSLGNSLSILNQLKTGFDNLSISTSNLASQVNNLKSSLGQLKSQSVNIKVNQIGGITAPKPVPNVFQSYTKGANDAGKATTYANMALTDMGRVVQDLPYGFIGISNNLNPLVESFRALSVQAKTAGTSVGKELLNSLKGFGGVGIAISAVSAALSFASIGLSYWSRNTRQAKDDNDKFAESIDKAKSSAMAQGLQMQNLLRQVTDSSLSLNAQKSALNELNEGLEKYGIYLTDISIKNGDAAKQVDLLTEGLILQAVAAKQGDRLAELTIKQRDLEKKRNEELRKSGMTLEQYNNITDKAYKSTTKRTYSIREAEMQDVSFNETTTASYKAIANLNAQLSENGKQLADLKIEYKDTSNQAKAYLDAAKTPEENLSRIKQLNKLIADENANREKITKTYGQASVQYEEITKKIKGYQDELDKIRGKEDKVGGKKAGEEIKSYSDLIAELFRDIEKIRSSPILTLDEKNKKVLETIKTGLLTIADLKPVEFKADVKGDVKKITDIFKVETAKEFFNQAINGASELSNTLESLDFEAKLFGDKAVIDKKISSVESQLRKTGQILFAFSKYDFGSTLNPLIEGFKTSIGLQLQFQQNQLKVLKGQKVDIDLKELFSKYNKEIELGDIKLNRIINNPKLTKSRVDSISQQISIYKSQLDKATETLQKSVALRFNPFSKENILIWFKDIPQIKKKLEKAVEDLDFAQQLERTAKSAGELFNSALIDIFSNIGNIGGENGKKTFGGIFANLIEGLGKELIKFGIISLKVNAIIEGLFAAFGEKASIAKSFAAIAFGATLVAAAQAAQKSLRMASGGYVSGKGTGTSDSIPARLSNGEYVVKADSVSKYGKGFLDMINQGTFKKFANGGLVTNLGIPGLQSMGYKSMVNNLSVSSSNIIAETRISGQDLRLILSRSDNRFNSTTSNPATSKSFVI